MITHILRQLPPNGGGTEKQAVLLSQTLHHRGINSIVVGSGSGTKPSDGVVSLTGELPPLIGGIIFHTKLLYWLFKHRNKLSAIQIYLVNPTSFLSSNFAKLFNIPLYYKVAGSGKSGDLASASSSKFKSLLWKCLCKNVSTFIAPSADTYIELDNFFINSNSKINICKIPNGVEFNPNIRPPDMTSTIMQCLCIGRFSEEKAYHNAIEATQNLSHKTFLNLVGHGPLEKQLHYLASTKTNIRVHPYTNTPKYWYSKSHILIISSHSEGLSNVMLEAMAMGLIVITTPVSGSIDVIENHKNGFIVDGFSAPAISATLQYILDMPASQKLQVAKEAQETIMLHYNIIKCADNYNRHVYKK